MATPIGETLRKARQQEGLSLSDAAARTCIRERFLRALEDEAFEVLGEDVYVRGFIRSYAKELGVDPAPLLETHREGHAHTPADEAALTSEVLASAERGDPTRLRRAAGASVVLLLFGLLVLIGQRGGAPDPAAPVEGTAPPRAAPAAPAGESEEPEPADAERPEPTTTPVPAFDGVEVAVTVRGAPSWLRVVVDGETAFEGIHDPGASVTYTGEEEVFLRIGNAGAVHLSVNGEDEGPAGDSGQVVEHRYDAEDPPPT